MAKRPPVFRTFTEAVEWFITLGIVTREEADQLTKAARAQAFWVSNVAQMDVVQDVFNEIERSLRLGLSLRDFKRSVAPKLYAAWGKADAWRLETIYRVNVMRAYNAGRYQRLSTPRVKRLLPFRRWKSLLDLDTTSQCRGRHNKILPADDPWWDDNWPPIHYNCRSIVAPINRRRAERLGVATAQDKKDFTPVQDGWGASPAKAEFSEYKPKPDGKDPRLFSTMTEKVEADAQLQSD